MKFKIIYQFKLQNSIKKQNQNPSILGTDYKIQIPKQIIFKKYIIIHLKTY